MSTAQHLHHGSFQLISERLCGGKGAFYAEYSPVEAIRGHSLVHQLPPPPELYGAVELQRQSVTTECSYNITEREVTRIVRALFRSGAGRNCILFYFILFVSEYKTRMFSSEKRLENHSRINQRINSQTRLPVTTCIPKAIRLRANPNASLNPQTQKCALLGSAKAILVLRMSN